MGSSQRAAHHPTTPFSHTTPITHTTSSSPVEDAVAVHVVHGLQQLEHKHLDALISYVVAAPPVGASASMDSSKGLREAVCSEGGARRGDANSSAI